MTHNTARKWLSVLEAGFLCVRIPSWHVNVRKQIIKAPKLHFLDTGLVCYLLGIHTAEQLRHHPLRGAIFESWVFSELYKHHVHRGQVPRIHHYRDARRLEVDLVLDDEGSITLIEVKSGATVASSFWANLHKLASALSRALGAAGAGVRGRYESTPVRRRGGRLARRGADRRPAWRNETQTVADDALGAALMAAASTWRSSANIRA